MDALLSGMINKVRYVLLILFFLSIGVHIYADYKGAEKGMKSNLFSVDLPQSLYPFIDSHSSFVLKDSNDMEVIGIGFRYATLASPIRNILAYGYNKSSIIVLCDFGDCKKNLISYIDNYNSISFREISYDQTKNNEYHWVNINNTDYNFYTKIKSWSFILSVIFFISFITTRRNLRP